MSQSRPDVSIVIRARDEARALPMTLEAIRRQHFIGTVEVIVVDSGSSDGTVEIARDGGARVVHLERRYSPGLASNVGFDAANAPICVLTSAAAFPANAAWLSTLLAPFDSRSETLAATFSRQMPVPDASPIEEAFLSMAFGSTATTVSFSSTSGAVRRAVWKRFPFEETFAAGGPDDREWYSRISLNGYGTCYVPASIVHRSHGYTLRQWFHRVWVDASGERTILERGGAPSAPTRSPARLAAATFRELLDGRHFGEVARYALLAPVLATARWMGETGRDPDRLDPVVRRLDVVDRRLFRAAERERLAIDRFLERYWAAMGSQEVRGG